MSNPGFGRWAILVVGIAATSLRCSDRDVSQILGTSRLEPAAGADAGSIPGCVPGQTLACMGACGGQLSIGYHLCADDGRSYGECVCPESGERPFIAIDPGSVLLAPEAVGNIRVPEPVPAGMTPVTARGIVGATCEDNADCQGSLGCLSSDSTLLSGGGVAGGYCTIDCADSDFCRSIDPLSACGTLGGERMCIKLCLSQTPEEGEPKCVSRSDLTCLSLAALGQEEPTGERQVGICVPQCQSDDSCGGRRCDLSQGICTDTPSPGAPIGSACEGFEECAGGVCLGLTQQTESFCSAFCTLGTTGCGYSNGDTPGAACLLAQEQGEGAGDRGLCLEVCETPEDCLESGSQCVPFESSPRGGVCLRPTGPVIVPPDPDPPVGGDPGIVGAACDADRDCSGGLGCVTASSTAIGGAGVAGGYCTTECTASEDCTSIDPISTCGTLGGERMCIRLCLSQTPEEGESKCLSRPDLTCLSVAALGQQEPTGEPQIGICVPQCQSDASCGDRSCDLSRGLCTDAPSSGDPIGSACDEPEQCAGGVCLGLGAQIESSCSAFCTLGVSGCGFGPDETPGAACVLAQIPGEGDGDQGLCLEVCETEDDCREPGSECQALSSSPLGGVCVRVTSDNEPPDNQPPDNQPPDNQPPDNQPPDNEPDAGSSEPEPDPVPTTGFSCDADEDCGSGTCLTSDSDPFSGIEGGPAGGYCSASCTGNDECEPGALCLPLPGGGRCFLRCSADEVTPCHGRDTLTCNLSSGSANGFCQPLCNSDADCGDRICAGPPDGLCIDPVLCASDSDCETGACDEERGICLPPEPCALDADCGGERICNGDSGTCARPPSVAAGGVCAVDADCPGEICLPTATGGFCSALCALGTPVGCELYGTGAFCLLRTAQAGIGFCAGLCNVPADCATPGFRCVSINGNINGNTGACLP